MPYVNLIQEQRMAAQANERKSRSFFSVFVGVLVVSGVAYGFLTMDALIVAHQAHGIEVENKKNEPIAKQIEQNGKDLSEMTPRMKTLEDAAVITGRWDRILNHLAVQTPTSTWLTGVKCQASDATKPIQVSFQGIATAQAPVGEYIMRLQNLKDLDNVSLRFTNEKVVAASKAIEFQIDSDIVGTAEQKIKTDVQGDQKK